MWRWTVGILSLAYLAMQIYAGTIVAYDVWDVVFTFIWGFNFGAALLGRKN